MADSLQESQEEKVEQQRDEDIVVSNVVDFQVSEKLHCLYLFASKKRVKDIRSCLISALRGTKVKLVMKEIDIVRGKKSQNLLSDRLQKALLKEVEESKYDLVLASPPCSTFSRARSANSVGPPPLRSSQHPRGFPWLSRMAKAQVTSSNRLVDFTVKLLTAQLGQGPKHLIVLEHPEDLGRRGNGAVPASIWQWPAIQRLAAQEGVVCGALFQYDFGSEYLKPTRILTNISEAKSIVENGKAVFDQQGAYMGPLQKRDFQGPSLVGQDSGHFRTKGSEAWPTGLCTAIAGLACKVLAKDRVTIPKGGASGQVALTTPMALTTSPGSSWYLPCSTGSSASLVSGTAPTTSATRTPSTLSSTPPPIPPTPLTTPLTARARRRKATAIEISMIRKETPLEEGHHYIGRIAGCRGCKSIWANPFRIGVHGNREGVITLYKQHLVDSGLRQKILELSGKTLLCHCADNEACHGDVLLDALGNAQDVKPKKRKLFEESPDHFKGNLAESEVLLDYIEDGLPCRVGEIEIEDLPVLRASGTSRGGKGPTRASHFMGKDRGYEDGGGLCSPGRWPRGQRTVPNGVNKELLIQARALLVKSVGRTSAGADSPLTLMIKVAAGKFSTSPFDPDVVKEMTDIIAELLGSKEDRKTIDERQAFRLPLIADLLKSLGDPDWQFFEQLREGVPIGVGYDFPRTTAVFDEKLKWSLDQMHDPLGKEATNYRSVEGYEDQVRQLFLEEAAEGWMVELTDAEAEKEFGANLRVAALAVVVEAEKIRVVHDGTNKVHVNNCIRVTDQARSPTAGEIRSLMREKFAAKNGCKQFLLLGDVSKAHRRIKIRRQDWGFQACRLEPGKVWINAVGTYGISSAGY